VVTGVERPSWFGLHDRLDHPYAVVRKTPPVSEEEACREGTWERCSLLRGVGNGGNNYEELPISPAEARQVTKRLDSRRVRGGRRP
jgi:hypothetical protein